MRKFLNIVRRMAGEIRQTVRRRGLAVGALALVIALGFTAVMPQVGHAAMTWTQIPGGAVAKNTKASVIQPMRTDSISPYGWQWSGPFKATLVTYTATVINPQSKATNCTDCPNYQGPVRVVGYSVNGAFQFQAQNVSYAVTVADGTTTTAYSQGLPFASGAILDTEVYGSLWPNSFVALQLSSTATSTTDNFRYWVLDQDW